MVRQSNDGIPAKLKADWRRGSFRDQRYHPCETASPDFANAISSPLFPRVDLQLKPTGKTINDPNRIPRRPSQGQSDDDRVAP
jgi:hypothetical protein